ncbi:MAG: DUF1700 domain-containing protein [Eubacteriales bacterium]|nr:DUF1700 domain-containing protein [Eubacteriales bacterium]
MNKTEFLDRLEKLLKSLDKQERRKFLAYYSEMIDDAMEDGCTEEEAVARIGSPGAAAEEILSEREIAPQKSSSTVKKITIAILLILGSPLWGSIVLAAVLLAAGLILTAAALVLSAYILIWCIPITAGAVAISSLILSVVSTLGAVPILLSNPALGVFQFGAGIMAAGAFILCSLAAQCTGKYFIKVTISFTKWLKGLFAKKKKEAII